MARSVILPQRGRKKMFKQKLAKAWENGLFGLGVIILLFAIVGARDVMSITMSHDEGTGFSAVIPAVMRGINDTGRVPLSPPDGYRPSARP